MSVLGLDILASYIERPRPPDPVAVWRQLSFDQAQAARDLLHTTWKELGIQKRLNEIGMPGGLEAVFSQYESANLKTIQKACSDPVLARQIHVAVHAFDLIQMAERAFRRDDLASGWSALGAANFALGLMYGRADGGRNARLAAQHLAMFRHRETADFRRIVIEYYQANRDRFPTHSGRPNKNAAAREICEKGLVNLEYEAVRNYLKGVD